MKFKSQLITQASGSIGGATWSRNKGGMYIRARSIPTNPNSEFQATVRNLMAQLVGRWTGVLDATAREGWALYADAVLLPDPLGEPRKVTPMNHYVRSNLPRLQAGLAVVDDAPTSNELAALTEPAGTATESDQHLSVAFTNTDTWATAVGGGLLVWISRPQAPTINYFKGPYQYAGKVPGAVVPPTSPVDIDFPFYAVEGQVLFVKYAATNATGELSSPFRERVTCAA